MKANSLSICAGFFWGREAKGREGMRSLSKAAVQRPQRVLWGGRSLPLTHVERRSDTMRVPRWPSRLLQRGTCEPAAVDEGPLTKCSNVNASSQDREIGMAVDGRLAATFAGRRHRRRPPGATRGPAPCCSGPLTSALRTKTRPLSSGARISCEMLGTTVYSTSRRLRHPPLVAPRGGGSRQRGMGTRPGAFHGECRLAGRGAPPHATAMVTAPRQICLGYASPSHSALCPAWRHSPVLFRTGTVGSPRQNWETSRPAVVASRRCSM